MTVEAGGAMIPVAAGAMRRVARIGPVTLQNASTLSREVTNTMSPRPPRPSYFTQQVPTWMARTIGSVALVIGLLLLGLSLLGVFRWVTSSRATSSREGLAVAVAIVMMIGLLFVLVGKRLVTGRSPHGDSLLSRAVWMLLGIAFVAMGTGFVVALPWNSDLGIPLLSTALFAIGCFGVAWRPAPG